MPRARPLARDRPCRSAAAGDEHCSGFTRRTDFLRSAAVGARTAGDADLVASPAVRAPTIVDDIKAEYERLKAKGVVFTMEPTETGPVTIAILADTCGNLLQPYQPADV